MRPFEIPADYAAAGRGLWSPDPMRAALALAWHRFEGDLDAEDYGLEAAQMAVARQAHDHGPGPCARLRGCCWVCEEERAARFIEAEGEAIERAMPRAWTAPVIKLPPPGVADSLDLLSDVTARAKAMGLGLVAYPVEDVERLIAATQVMPFVGGSHG